MHPKISEKGRWKGKFTTDTEVRIQERQSIFEGPFIQIIRKIRTTLCLPISVFPVVNLPLVFGSFAGGAHFYEFRIESAEYFYQVGLSGHHAIDIFVNAGNFV